MKSYRVKPLARVYYRLHLHTVYQPQVKLYGFWFNKGGYWTTINEAIAFIDVLRKEY